MKYTRAWLGNFECVPLQNAKSDNLHRQPRQIQDYWVVPGGAIHTTAQLYLMAIALQAPLWFEIGDSETVCAIMGE